MTRVSTWAGWGGRAVPWATVILALAVSVGACNDDADSAQDEGSPPPGPDMAASVDGSVDGSAGGEAGAPDAAPDAAPPMADASAPDAGFDYTEVLFEPDHLLEVRVEMAEAAWDAMRRQGRDGSIFVGEDCMDQPFESVFTWFGATVTVDGETIENAGIRKKGFFGSLSETKPSLKIRFDKFIEGQLLQGVKRMTFNNARQDPTFLRQCLSYQIFRAAGVPAPRCNFAHVEINGDDMGVYVHVESIKRPFLRRFFADDEGHLYEGTLSDFREGWTATIEQKTSEEIPYTAPIDGLVAALRVDDDGLIDALSAVIDLDAFLTFWAVEIIVAHWDGYSGNTNNFYFYDDPTSGLIHFIPWGTDGTFVPPRRLFEGQMAPRSINAAGVLARRLYLHPEGQRMYLDRLISLMDAHWDPATLQARADAMAGVITRAVRPAVQGRYVRNLGELRDFLGDHGGRIRAEVTLGPAEWPFPLRGNLCLAERGHATGSFDTRWGTWPTQDTFETGDGEVALTLFGEEIAIAAVGGAAGIDEEDGVAMLLIPMFIEEDRLFFFRFAVPAQRFEPRRYDLSSRGIECVLVQFTPSTRAINMVAECPQGHIEFRDAGGEDRDRIRGTFDVALWARGR